MDAQTQHNKLCSAKLQGARHGALSQASANAQAGLQKLAPCSATIQTDDIEAFKYKQNLYSSEKNDFWIHGLMDDI
jgi:hypothetical protein